MKNLRYIFSTLFLALCVLFVSCTPDQHVLEPNLENSESILDRKVFIEPELLTEIPQIPRFCDQIELTKHRINVGDVELYVEEEGRGTPLVLINGGPGGTHHYFHPWFSRVKKYARIIYYDQRGCGLSDFKPGEEGYSVEQAINDLDAIRKALNIDKWVVLGYSYGGFLAQYYALHYPEHMSGMILLGAAPNVREDTGPSRQNDFISKEEQARLKEVLLQLNEYDKENDLSRKDYIQILIYNNFLNGDWKRQQFYRPSLERIAQNALYEWDQDENFNGILNSSRGRVDLTGAFKNNPIPTLILEGRWDLTWGEKKKEILKNNHPNGEMVVFENGSHGIYDEDPDRFFSVLKKFIKTIPKIKEEDIEIFKESLIEWDKAQKASPDYIIESTGWGRNSNKILIQSYSREWLEQFDIARQLLKIGFALYDFEMYDDALLAFEKMEDIAEREEDKLYMSIAVIWQGHMLDLMEKREDAISRYKKVVAMNLDFSPSHGQYGMRYEVTPYAQERMKSPFKRIENNQID
ncbi:MAG: alpha/beta fold hydrolase [Candidatus Aminicenantes bacterium]|nr:alpha/beta fold hydrolase [Candidatus Aminicenantes bacterium]